MHCAFVEMFELLSCFFVMVLLCNVGSVVNCRVLLSAGLLRQPGRHVVSKRNHAVVTMGGGAPTGSVNQHRLLQSLVREASAWGR